MNDMKYPGQELEIFDKANIWRKYIHVLIKYYFKDNFLEVGAGIGSFTENYYKDIKNIVLTDLDEKNITVLREKFSHEKNIKIENKKINEIEGKFNTIIYLNVLEHIEEDLLEINSALEKLNAGGHLIIIVPAHQKLYSNFDKAVGHCRRYDINFFRLKKFENAKIQKLLFLDLLGYILYFFNKTFYKNEVYPSKFKIFLWDKIFSPITIVLDFFTRYKFGKNILCVYKKD
tara:strand:- start:1051 stop:1743 length:693 start_codon:yes stop_codon:yes gene_type:complete